MFCIWAKLAAMKLAKPHLDVGLFSTKRDEQLAFWQQTVGLPYDHHGQAGRRHAAAPPSHERLDPEDESRARSPAGGCAPSGIVGLQIAREGTDAAQALADPDGNKVTLVPKGQHGVEGIAILLRVNDPVAHDRLLDPGHAVRAGGRRPLPLRRFADRGRRTGQGRAPRARNGAGLAIATRRYRSGIASPNTRASWRVAATSGGEPRMLGDTVRYAFVSIPTATTSRSASAHPDRRHCSSRLILRPRAGRCGPWPAGARLEWRAPSNEPRWTGLRALRAA